MIKKITVAHMAGSGSTITEYTNKLDDLDWKCWIMDILSVGGKMVSVPISPNRLQGDLPDCSHPGMREIRETFDGGELPEAALVIFVMNELAYVGLENDADLQEVKDLRDRLTGKA